MKKLLFLSLLSFLATIMLAQGPNKFRYQAVARNQSGSVITGNLTIRMSFIEDGLNGTDRYSETHQVNTNPQGVFELTIGAGTPEFGSMDLVDWGNHEYWLQVEMKIPEEAGFTELGKTQLLSVPYAMYATTSGTDLTAGQGININNGIISNSGDLSNSNEIQTLSVNGNQLAISNGNTVSLPTGTTYTEGAGIDIAGNSINAIDASPTNEIQQLSINGQQLSLSNGGGTVQLPGGGSGNWTTNGTNISNSPISYKVGIGSVNTYNSKVYVEASGTDNGGYFFTSGTGSALKGVNNGTGLGLYVSSQNGNGGEFESVNGTAATFASTSGPALTTGNGNVGIGLPNPARKLHVSGSSLFTNPNGGVALEVGAGKVGIGITSPTHKFEVNGVSFFENFSGHSLLVGNGNVGIGTHNPTTKLFVEAGNQDGVYINSNTGYGIFAHSSGIFPAGQFISIEGIAGTFYSNDNFAVHARQGQKGTATSTQGIQLQEGGDTWKMYIDIAKDYNFAYGNTLRAWILDTDGSYHNSSDRSLKKNIQSFTNVLPRLTKLQAYTYQMKNAEDDSPVSLGFMAQDVEELFPQLVTEKEGFKSLCYDHFAVLSVEAIKEQQVEIEALKKQVEELKALMMELVKASAEK